MMSKYTCNESASSKALEALDAFNLSELVAVQGNQYLHDHCDVTYTSLESQSSIDNQRH